MAEDLSEAPLVMIETLRLLVVHTTDIYYNIASVQNCRIPGPL